MTPTDAIRALATIHPPRYFDLRNQKPVEDKEASETSLWTCTVRDKAQKTLIVFLEVAGPMPLARHLYVAEGTLPKSVVVELTRLD